jgi:hypothetical protein
MRANGSEPGKGRSRFVFCGVFTAEDTESTEIESQRKRRHGDGNGVQGRLENPPLKG